MIEQTELVVTKWQYTPLPHFNDAVDELTNKVTFEVMKKTSSEKKGIACRFSCIFYFEAAIILDYVAENSYVIDFEEVIDKKELHTMIRNTYTLFNQKYDLRKLGTILQNKSLKMIDETSFELESVLRLLN